jgi:hypothetical protein
VTMPYVGATASYEDKQVNPEALAQIKYVAMVIKDTVAPPRRGRAVALPKEPPLLRLLLLSLRNKVRDGRPAIVLRLLVLPTNGQCMVVCIAWKGCRSGLNGQNCSTKR